MSGSMRWEVAARPFADAVRAYHSERGRPPDSPAVVSTVRTNSELVPRRANNLVQLLNETTGVSTLEGLRILEVGSGFGAFATYLSLTYRPSHVVAIDTRPDLLRTARDAVAELELDNIEFVQSDMRALQGVGSEFDVLIANNAFIYLSTRGDMRQALREFRSTLASGGAVFMYHANRWAPREPFTKDPIVHLLPPRVAEPVSRVTGWKHNHGRVRLASAPSLMFMLWRAGFRHPRMAAVYRGNLVRWSALYQPFYGVGAHKP